MENIQRDTHRYFIADASGRILAELDYAYINHDMTYTVDSIFVSPELRGQGIASQLLDAIVTDAKSEDKTIKAVCPYAKAASQRYPEKYQEIEYKP